LSSTAMRFSAAAICSGVKPYSSWAGLATDEHRLKARQGARIQLWTGQPLSPNSVHLCPSVAPFLCWKKPPYTWNPHSPYPLSKSHANQRYYMSLYFTLFHIFSSTAL
jgi:hypothetical protein